MTKTAEHVTEGAPTHSGACAVVSGRAPYRAPKLSALGTVRDLTLGLGGSKLDGALSCRVVSDLDGAGC
ncbi:MAG: lasso RiPP family leader peptide-containing protein [Polyangiaceae bacterium]